MLTCFVDHMHLISHAQLLPMSTCFDKNMSTCLYALMLIYSDTFMIECSYVNMVCWSHAFNFTCHDDRVLPCLHTLMITCPIACMPLSSYAWTLWWLPTPFLKCFDDSMLTCINIHMFDIYTHVHTLGWCLLAWRQKWSYSRTF